MNELENILKGLKLVKTAGDDTIIMAQCLTALTQYINIAKQKTKEEAVDIDKEA